MNWFPQSDYYAQNLEHEYHAEKAVGKKPTIDMYLQFANELNEHNL